jgi:hypothetical protein
VEHECDLQSTGDSRGSSLRGTGYVYLLRSHAQAGCAPGGSSPSACCSVRSSASGRIGVSRRGSQRSPARRHGRRRARRPRSVRESASGFTAVVGCVQGGQGHGSLFPSLFATVHEALGHDKAPAVRTGLTRRRRPTREERGQGSNLAPGIDTRAWWGARWRGASGLRGDARERKRERKRDRLGAASRTRVATHGGQRRHGKARPRKWRALTKATAPSSQPGTKAGITSGGAAARSIGAFHLGSMAGATTRGGKRSSSSRWPWAEV